MTDLGPHVIKNIFKYVAIKAHYLFRQSTNLNTLVISKHDWKLYSEHNTQEIIGQKYIKYKLFKNPNIEYSADSYFKKIKSISFYIGYKKYDNKDSLEKNDKDNIDIFMILNNNQTEMAMNDIYKDIICFDFTANSSFQDFSVLSKQELNKMLVIINRDIPKEYKYSLQYKLIESEYFENPHYLLYNQYIPTQGIKSQLRHLT
jgi:hypothetical protein